VPVNCHALMMISFIDSIGLVEAEDPSPACRFSRVSCRRSVRKS